jgi:uncharacterized membrane protein
MGYLKKRFYHGAKHGTSPGNSVKMNLQPPTVWSQMPAVRPRPFPNRLAGLIAATSVVWSVTREIELAATVGIADTLLKFGLYYPHEGAWLRGNFGIRAR